MSTYIEGRIAPQPPGNTGTHNLIPMMRSVITSAYEIWVSPEGDDDVGTGHILFPYQTLAKAVSMATATRKKVMLLPGTYTSAASIAVPVGVTDVLFSGITSDYESTVVHASAGAEVFNITPNATIGAANVLVFFANMYISGADGVNGVEIDNTNMTAGKKLIVTFRECGFGADTETDESISMTHTDADSIMKLYLHGRGLGGCNVEGLLSLDTGHRDSRVIVNGMTLEGGVTNTADDVDCCIEYNSCIVPLSGGAGGHASHLVNANGCVSRDGVATWAAAVTTDFAASCSFSSMSLA